MKRVDFYRIDTLHVAQPGFQTEVKPTVYSECPGGLSSEVWTGTNARIWHILYEPEGAECDRLVAKLSDGRMFLSADICDLLDVRPTDGGILQVRRHQFHQLNETLWNAILQAISHERNHPDLVGLQLRNRFIFEWLTDHTGQF